MKDLKDLTEAGLSEERVKEIEKMAEEIHGGWWNYRFIRFDDTIICPDNSIENISRYEIHEVYYKKDGSIWSYSESPLDLVLEDYDELKYLKREIKKALKRSILLFEGDEDDWTLIDTHKYMKGVRFDN